MGGRFHPLFNRKRSRIVIATHVRNVLAYNSPSSEPKAVGPIVNHRAVDPAVTEEFVRRHVLRVESGDCCDLVVPFQFGKSLCFPLGVDKTEYLSLEISGCSRRRNTKIGIALGITGPS